MAFQRDLVLSELALAPSVEWVPAASGWTVMRVRQGIGYWLGSGSACEMAPDDAAVLPPGGAFVFRASRIGAVTIQYFTVQPGHLTGVLRWSERTALEQVAPLVRNTRRVLPSSDPLAQRFTAICAQAAAGDLVTRCRLLQIWADFVAPQLVGLKEEVSVRPDAKARFRQLITGVPEAELRDRSIDELSKAVRCSARHFSRLFKEEFGTSLRAKQAELRLIKAHQLLAESDAKVITVALESGYRHLSLFNTSFKMRFGVTPSEWRRQAARKPRPQRLGRLVAQVSLALLPFMPWGPFRVVAQEVPRRAAPAGGTPAAATNAPAAASPAPTFEVRHYEIRGSTLISDAVLAGIFTNAVGPKVSLDRIHQALAELQLAYRERGFVTAGVSLPQQQLTNAIVKVQVTEGTLAEINVLGNRHFSSNNVRRALPSLRTNAFLNSHVLQRELDRANANADRQIYPNLAPGPDPGTSALNLKVKDRLPAHGRFDLNNYNTPNTPDLRMNLAGQYNNLWQREHQIGAQYGFTPGSYKDGDVAFYDQPLIAYYSAYYRLPLGGAAALQDAITAKSADFGYSEATRQFRLPAQSGRPDVTVYASRSSSDTAIQYGPQQIVTQSPLLTIVSQDSGQDLTVNANVGARFVMPLPETPERRLAFSAGLDWKGYELSSYNTNNFYIRTVVTNEQGSQIIETRVASPQPTRENALSYLPLTVGFDVAWRDLVSSTTLSVSGSYNLLTGDATEQDFSNLLTNAASSFGKLNLSLTHEQKLGRGWSALLRAGGQVSFGPLISNEQFALGGMGTVRGYHEGEDYGDSGWFVSLEPRTPLVDLGMVDGKLPMWVRASAFVDYGERYLEEPLPGLKPRAGLWGVGCAVSANVGNRFDVRLALGVPLLDTPTTCAGNPRILFTVGTQL